MRGRSGWCWVVVGLFGCTVSVDGAGDPPGPARVAGACAPGEERSCYAGPEGTEAVGACAPGLQACGEDGSWGSCTGYTRPTAELCSTPVDDDCDGEVNENGAADAPRWFEDADGDGLGSPASWSRACVPPAGEVAAGDDCDDERFDEPFEPCGWGVLGDGDGEQTPIGLVPAPDGAVIVAGRFGGSWIDLGGGPRTTGAPGSFVARYARDGRLAWEWLADRALVVTHLALAPDGSVVAGGRVVSAGVMLGQGPVEPQGLDPFVAVLAPDGSLRWSRAFVNAGDQELSGLAVAEDGELELALNGDGPFDLGCGPVSSSGHEQRFVLAGLAPDGRCRWSRRREGTARERVTSLSVDPDGELVVAGVEPGAGRTDAPVGAFVLRLGRDGVVRWDVRATGAFPRVTLAMARDGSLALGGSYQGAVELAGVPMASTAESSFVLRLGPDGAYGALWDGGSRLGGRVEAMSFTADGELLLGGRTVPPTVDSGASIFVPGLSPAPLAVLDAAGTVVAELRPGTGGSLGIRGLAGMGSWMAIAGVATGALELGTTSLESPSGAPRLFVATVPIP